MGFSFFENTITDNPTNIAVAKGTHIAGVLAGTHYAPAIVSFFGSHVFDEEVQTAAHIM